MSFLPGTFSREQIVKAFEALGLTDDDLHEDISQLLILPTELEIGFYVRDTDGYVIEVDGAPCQAFYTIPVDENTVPPGTPTYDDLYPPRDPPAAPPSLGGGS